MATPESVEHKRLLAEIHEEVARRREAGDFPRDLERDLDALFNRFAPPSVSDDFGAVLAKAEDQAFIDYDVPLDSAKLGVPQVKKVLRKTMAWYVRYVAMQVSDFAATIARSVRLLDRRVERLEASVPGADRRIQTVLSGIAAPSDPVDWSSVVCEWMTPVHGRVVVAECGDGALLSALKDKGVDAYGVEPQRALAQSAAESSLEVRVDSASEHLYHVAEAALSGIVLRGCVDRLSLGAQLELADLAFSKLGDNGRFVVLVSGRSGSERSQNVIERDLAPGRPLHAETWRHLLTERGFHDVEVRNFQDSDGDSASDQRLMQLEDAVYGPAVFAIMGVRESRAS